MKYIKKFESNKPFNIGDIVVLKSFEFEFAEIINTYKSSMGVHLMFADGDKNWFVKSEIRHVTPEEKEQYNIEVAANKYNL